MWPILRNFVMVACLMAVTVIAIRDYTLLFDAPMFDTPAAEKSIKISEQSENPQNHSQNGWELEIDAGSYGHFRVDAEINGETEGFLVDTGASLVSFSLETAERLGFNEA